MPKAIVALALALLLGACGVSTSSSSSSSTTQSVAPTSLPTVPVTTRTTEPAIEPTSTPQPAADPGQTITVGGVGRVFAEPVRCIVDLGVTVRRPTVLASSRVAASSAESMRQVLLGQGVDPSDIQTIQYDVGPYYDNWPDIGGYETTISYRVSIPDVDSVGAVLGAATEAGGDDVRAYGFRFETDPSLLTDDARKIAWDDVMHRAEETAALANEPLGVVVDVHEKVLVSTSQGMFQGGEGDSASFDIPVSPGVSGVVVLLTVTFAIG